MSPRETPSPLAAASIARLEAMNESSVDAMNAEQLLDLLVSAASPETREQLKGRLRAAVQRGAHLRDVSGSPAFERVLARFVDKQRQVILETGAHPFVIALARDGQVPAHAAMLLLGAGAEGEDVLVIPALCTSSQLYLAVHRARRERRSAGHDRVLFPNLPTGDIASVPGSDRDDLDALLQALPSAMESAVRGLGSLRALPLRSGG